MLTGSAIELGKEMKMNIGEESVVNNIFGRRLNLTGRRLRTRLDTRIASKGTETAKKIKSQNHEDDLK